MVTGVQKCQYVLPMLIPCFNFHFYPFRACFVSLRTFQQVVQYCKCDGKALLIILTRQKKKISKINVLDFILFVIFYEQITKYTSFTNWKYLQFLYNKALLRFWFMAFLEHSVFQNKDIGVVFSTLFIYTLHVRWERFGRVDLHSLFDTIYWANWGWMHLQCEKEACADALLVPCHMIWGHRITPDAADHRGQENSSEPSFLCPLPLSPGIMWLG